MDKEDPVYSQSEEVRVPTTGEPATATSAFEVKASEPILIWQEREKTDTNRDQRWYVLFSIVVVFLFIVSIWLFKSFTFARLIPVMAAALLISLRRPAVAINYTASYTNITIGSQSYFYTSFKSFSVTINPNQNWLTLIPRKRFAIPVVVYFPEDIGEQLVDVVASQLPMSQHKPDLLEKIIAYLRLQ